MSNPINIPKDILEGFHINTMPPNEDEANQIILDHLNNLQKINFIRMVAGGLFTQRFHNDSVIKPKDAETCWNDARLLWEVKPKDC